MKMKIWVGKTGLALLVGTLALGLLSMPAAAGVIRFDDAYASLGQVGNPSTFYLGSDGLTISGNYIGLIGGNGNGDPGNWNLEGTNGSAFLGCNQGDNCSQTFHFGSQLSSISLDVGIPGFGWSGQVTADFLSGVAVVGTSTQSISSPADPGNWSTFSFSGAIDGVRVTTSFTSGFAMGIDNIQYTTAGAVPEPETYAMMLAGLGLLGFAARRRK